ncbi:Dedicator of cytokinesis protein 3 [Rhizoctonia solani]|uniref:Dedicator of cytokinesis protein 3 n=1 Tax=Rhizoctonia solani TaxID=456999 RepID=A0A8H8NX42_9AGAM|nr:Dedicator of cytokinesis protein 3 [Rhizoctonia solani]QRW21721.1 Dedicator of cytokinesis protein 3 [Rhizoctonia solani]
MGWEPLPLLLYGFAIHPLSHASPTTNDRVSSIGPPRLELDAIPEHAHRNPHLARLDVGDEIYAFEAWRDAGPTWYRGYIVCTSNTPSAPAPPDPSPAQSTILGIPPAQDNTTVVEDPQVTIGIFPATHVHIRDELPDAEGLPSSPRPCTPAGFHMATLQEEPDSPRSPLHEKPEAPRPTLKSGDETALGLVEPLVDEIASALREWHARLFTYLAKRDYRTFTSGDELRGIRRAKTRMRHAPRTGQRRPGTRRACPSPGRGRPRFVLPPPAPALLSNPQSQSRGRKEETTRPKFHHILLDLRAFVAAPCAPGEYTELFFSLYSKAGASFVTEDFCVILNRNGRRIYRWDDRKPEAPIRTLFTDLGSHDLSEGLVLVCRIVRRGGMKLAPDGEAESPGKPGMGTIEESNTLGLGAVSEQGHGSFSSARSPRRGSEPMYKSVWEDSMTQLPPPAQTKPRRKSKSETAEDLRRPFGCAVLELDLGASTRKGLPVLNASPRYPPSRRTVHGKKSKIDARRLIGENHRADMIAVTLKTLYGDSATLIHENPSLLHSVPLTSRLGFPDVVFPGDTRNDAFIKLWSGEFQHTGSPASSLTRARTRKSIGALVGGMGGLGPPSVEVSVQVRTRGGRTLDTILSAGSGQPPQSTFRSTVLYKSHTPSYGELVKVKLEDEADHLFFTFRNRRGPAFAFAYLPLFPDGRAFVSDGTHRLVLYKTEKIESVQPKDYFGAPASVPGPSTKIELAPALARVLQPTRDALVDKDELASVLGKFTFVGEVEIVKFLQDIFDALFAVLVSPLNSRGELDDLVFSVLVTVLGIIQDRRFNNFQPVLDVYIDQHFSCAAAAGHMIHSMNRLLSSPSGEETRAHKLLHSNTLHPSFQTCQSFSTTELVPIVTGFTNSLVSTKGKLVVWKLLMYIQFVRSFVFDDPKSRSLLVESIISWIKPHFGKFNEFTMTSAGDSDAARDAARVGWLETTRLCITVVAVMLDKLQMCLVDPTIRADRRLFRQEEDNVEFLLSLLPK